MESQVSSPHSQEHATCPYRGPYQSSPYPPPHPTSWRSILILSHIYVWLFQVVSFPQISPPELCMHLSSPHTCHMPRQSYSSWFDHLNNIWRLVQIIKLLVMQSSPFPVTSSSLLTLNLLTTTIVAPPSNASKWQMGFNSAFKGLTVTC